MFDYYVCMLNILVTKLYILKMCVNSLQLACFASHVEVLLLGFWVFVFTLLNDHAFDF